MAAPEASIATTVVVTGTTPSDRGTLVGDSAPTSGVDHSPPRDAIRRGSNGSNGGPGNSTERDGGAMRQPSMGGSPPAKENGEVSSKASTATAKSDEVEILGETAARPTMATPVLVDSTNVPTLGGKRSSLPAGGTVPMKEKIQTKFSFGLIKDREPQLLKEVADKEKQLGELTRQLTDLLEKDTQREAEVQRLQAQCNLASEERSEEEERTQRYQSVLKKAMLEAARAHRRDARRSISDTNFNLGQVVTVQTAMGSQDMWVHGNEYREIHDEINRLKERLAECEAAKKDAQSEKRSLASKNTKHQKQLLQQQQAVPQVKQQQGGQSPLSDEMPSPHYANAPVADGGGLVEPKDETSQGFLHPNEALRGGRGVSLKACLPTEYLAAETQTDIHSVEVAKIRAEIDEKEKLRCEMDLRRLPFLKECTRVRDEDSSAFAHIPIVGPAPPPEEAEHHPVAGGGLALAPVGGFNTNSNPKGANSAPTERYVLMHLLGKGGFSEVWKAFDIVEGRHVALKIHAVEKNWQLDVKQSFFKHIRREFEIQKQINHEQVVKLYDVFNVDDGRQRRPGEETCVSVMEYCSGTDLDTELKKSGSIKELKARLILRQILAGLKALHENGVIHYDLKPANILFTTDLSSCLTIKITDFGLSKQVSGQGNMSSNNPQVELTSQGTGTFWYLPPECFQKGKVNIGYEVDVWALGVVFFQMLYGKKPFADKNSQREIWNGGLIPTQAKSGVEFPPDPPNGRKEDRISEGAKRFIEMCLQENPALRPTAAELAQDPYCSPLGAKRARNMTDPSPGEDARPLAPNLRQ